MNIKSSKSKFLQKGILSILLFITNSFSGWEYQESGTQNRLHDICFVDSLNGWAVGDYGTIIHTNNGGKTWEKQDSPTTQRLAKVNMLNDQIGQILLELLYTDKDTNIVLFTNNGGETWIGNDTDKLLIMANGIFFLNADTGWISGASDFRLGYVGAIVKTTDGGKTWTRQIEVGANQPPLGPSQVFIDIGFYDEFLGWAIRSTYTDLSEIHLYRTIDGGKNWTVFPESQGIFHSNHIKIISQDTLIAYTSTNLGITYNGGFDWDYDFPYFPKWDFLSFNGKKGWILTNHALHFMDLTSKEARTILEENTFKMYSMSGDGIHNLWIVGEKGKIIKVTNPELPSLVAPRQFLPKSFHVKQNYPNPFNSYTVIPYEVDNDGQINISIYNLFGKKISELINKHQSKGFYKTYWNGKNEDGLECPSGMYIVKITTSSESDAGFIKILLIR